MSCSRPELTVATISARRNASTFTMGWPTTGLALRVLTCPIFCRREVSLTHRAQRCNASFVVPFPDSGSFERRTLGWDALHQVVPGFDERCGSLVQKLSSQGIRVNAVIGAVNGHRRLIIRMLPCVW